MGILFVSYPSFLLLTWIFVGVEYLFALWFWVDKDLGYFPRVLSGKPQIFLKLSGFPCNDRLSKTGWKNLLSSFQYCVLSSV